LVGAGAAVAAGLASLMVSIFEWPVE
jgi:hypothetical protein